MSVCKIRSYVIFLKPLTWATNEARYTNSAFKVKVT